jgi:hypothetical protein
VESFVGEENKNQWRHLPFNPGGRAVDGFHYPLYDAILGDRTPMIIEEFDFPIKELKNPRGPTEEFPHFMQREVSAADGGEV